MPFAAFIPLIASAVSAFGSLIGQNQQKKHNMELARYQAEANERYQQQQNAYNTPASQMARFRDAGLNPHLVYSQGNAGNQSSPLSHPGIQNVDVATLWRDIIPNMTQMALTQSQIRATDARTVKAYSDVELQKVQKQLMEHNPLLNDAGFKAIIDGLKATAALKQQDLGLRKIQTDVAGAAQGHVVSKLFHEVELLEQRFQLGQQDKALKAQVLKSKEFQNAILEVQKKFMTDGDITPQHVLQFIQMLLLKAF